MNKSALLATINAQLRAELALQTSAALLARDEAISEESRAENKYDTHSQEAAYLAEGQARQAAEIEASLTHYATLALPAFSATDPIALGAIVELTAGGKSTWYFIGPRAGGMELNVGDRVVLVVTPSSPLGRQLVGRRVGDLVNAIGRAAGSKLRIASVA